MGAFRLPHRRTRLRSQEDESDARENRYALAIKERLKQARSMRRYSQSELARLCGLPQTSISRWENPDLPQLPKGTDFGALAEVLDVSLDWLIGRPNTDGPLFAVHRRIEKQLLEQSQDTDDNVTLSLQFAMMLDDGVDVVASPKDWAHRLRMATLHLRDLRQRGSNQDTTPADE